MSSTYWYGWQNLPDLIFNDIMVRVGLESLGDLNNCRQVCQTWNDMIWKMPKDTIRRHHESLAPRSEETGTMMMMMRFTLPVSTRSPPQPDLLTMGFWEM